MMVGMVYGNAENAWAYFSDRDDRMQPYAEDGSPQRAHLLLITKSRDVTVRDLKLHNSTDWTFRAVRNVNCVNSSCMLYYGIYADVHISADSYNNEG